MRRLDYKQIEKNPSKWRGTKGWFKGKIFNIDERGEYPLIQINVCGRGYDCNLFVIAAFGETKLIRGKWATIYGFMAGSKTYSSVLGRKITVPLMIATSASWYR